MTPTSSALATTVQRMEHRELSKRTTKMKERLRMMGRRAQKQKVSITTYIHIDIELTNFFAIGDDEIVHLGHVWLFGTELNIVRQIL
jgi:hypothetical protein